MMGPLCCGRLLLLIFVLALLCLCGSVQGLSKLPAYMPFTASTPTPWREMFPTASADALDLLKK